MRLKKRDWYVSEVSQLVARDLVNRYHYSGGGSNTAVYRHGLFKHGLDECLGVAWWIPPTKPAAKATYPENWGGVLSLTRLAISPEVPSNGASFLLGKSMKLVNRVRWPCLVTYADQMQNHTGAIYRATNWTYVGLTKKEPTYFRNGVMIARKAGPKTRTRQQMIDLGCVLAGSFAKHKFIHVVPAPWE